MARNARGGSLANPPRQLLNDSPSPAPGMVIARPMTPQVADRPDRAGVGAAALGTGAKRVNGADALSAARQAHLATISPGPGVARLRGASRTGSAAA